MFVFSPDTIQYNTIQYNFIAKWQMHQEHVVVPNALTHTLTSVIKKKKEKKRKEKRD